MQRVVVRYKTNEIEGYTNLEADEILHTKDLIQVLKGGVLVGMWKTECVVFAYITTKDLLKEQKCITN